MILENSEIEYKDFVIGLCVHKDDEGMFYEAYYRLKHQDKSREEYTYNNWFRDKESAYNGTRLEIDIYFYE